MQAGIQEIGDAHTRKKIISPNNRLSVSKQCKLLNIHRSRYYNKTRDGESDTNLEMMKDMDRQHNLCPAMGALQMVDFLRGKGFKVGRKLVRRLMKLMNMQTIYLMKSLSKGGWVKYRMPYLLRNLDIAHRNQVWSTDISYIPMENGFMYLYAIIDVYSRYVVGWELYNALDASNAIEVLEEAIKRYGVPEIINSDQGCQYTSEEWHKACEKHHIQISMDGRARCLDNVWIERFWRTIKREYVYLNPESDARALHRGISRYTEYYNHRRCHQGIDHKIPAAIYAAIAA